MNVTNRAGTALVSTAIAMATLCSGIGSASAQEWVRKDWRKEVICTFDFTHNDIQHYVQDGCDLTYGSFQNFGMSMEAAGYWSPDRAADYTLNDAPVAIPTTSYYGPATYPYQYDNEKGYYWAAPGTTLSRSYVHRVHATPLYPWRCVKTIVTDRRLEPCML